MVASPDWFLNTPFLVVSAKGMNFSSGFPVQTFCPLMLDNRLMASEDPAGTSGTAERYGHL